MTMTQEELRAKAVLRFRSARKHLIDFTKFTFPEYEANWHHILVAEKLMAWLRGDIKNLILMQPPRTGKSELVSRRLPAFAWGLDPKLRFVTASYSGELANSFNMDAQRTIEHENYQLLFGGEFETPSTSRAKNRDKFKQTSNLIELIKTNKRTNMADKMGFYKTVGVGGSLTGFGFDRGIIDDPFKNRKEADSEVIRQGVWDWYTSTFATRAEKGAGILLTLTRWHEDDLAGRLINLMNKDPNARQFEIIKLPHVKTEEPSEYDKRELGELLWPNKYSKKDVETMRVESGPRDWAALHQQSPSSAGGNIIKREWWKMYDKPPKRFDQIIQSWDFTFKGTAKSDYVVGMVWGRKGADCYALDLVRKQMSFIESLSAIQTMSAKWPECYQILIEDKANGPAIIDTLKRKVMGVTPFNPDKFGSKEARANAVSGRIEAGNAWLPNGAPWVHDYIEEFSAFPNGKHDDQVDATTQALLKLNVSGIERLERLLNM